MTQTQLALYRFTLNLKHLRLINKISQVELAQKLKISSRKLQRLEAGEAVPSLDLLVNLAGILNTNLEHLVYYQSDKSLNSLLLNKSDLNQAFAKLHDELLAGDELDLMAIANTKAFKESELPLKLTNYVQTVFNRNFTNKLQKSIIKPMMIHRAGDLWNNRKDFMKMANELLCHDEAFYQFNTELSDQEEILNIQATGMHKLQNNKVISLVMIEE